MIQASPSEKNHGDPLPSRFIWQIMKFQLKNPHFLGSWNMTHIWPQTSCIFFLFGKSFKCTKDLLKFDLPQNGWHLMTFVNRTPSRNPSNTSPSPSKCSGPTWVFNGDFNGQKKPRNQQPQRGWMWTGFLTMELRHHEYDTRTQISCTIFFL